MPSVQRLRQDIGPVLREPPIRLNLSQTIHAIGLQPAEDLG